MGNNRKSNTANGGGGGSVEIDNMSTPDEPSEKLIYGMSVWQSGVLKKPENFLNDEGIDCIWMSIPLK